jgi:hypothetical protein
MIFIVRVPKKKNLKEKSFMIALPSFLTPLAAVVVRCVFARE